MVREFQNKRKMSSNGIEWDFILGFIAFLLIWLFVGHQLLYNYANGVPSSPIEKGDDLPVPHPLAAYGIFMLFYSVLFFMLGQSIHKGLLTAGISLIGYILVDIWTPPMMINSGLVLKSPILVTLGVFALALSIIFFIIANRIGIPYRLYIFGGFIILGSMFLVLGIQYQGDPFVQTSCSEIPTPPSMPCIGEDGDVQIPGNMALSTDSFLYLFFRNMLSIPHILSWLITYFLCPVFIVVILAIALSREQMKKAVVDGWSQ